MAQLKFNPPTYHKNKALKNSKKIYNTRAHQNILEMSSILLIVQGDPNWLLVWDISETIKIEEHGPCTSNIF